jgi:hypothetical protein
VYLVIALLAIQVARGHASGGQTDSRGALETIAHHALGHLLVLGIGVGFGCLSLWQAILAVSGGPDPGGTRRGGRRRRASGGTLWNRRRRLGPGGAVQAGPRRLAAAAKAVIDAAMCLSALAIAASRPTSVGGDTAAVDVTARVMRHSAGRLVVGAVGIAIGVVGLQLIAKGARKTYDVDVRISDVPVSVRRAFETIGELGMFARGIIVGLAGFFALQAAITFNPAHAKGLDGVLASVVHDPWGPWLLGAVALGLACFGLFSLLEARYART